MGILTQFVFRLSFGLALAMWATSSKKVTSGFFRVHLWVILGLATLGCLATISISANSFSVPALSWQNAALMAGLTALFSYAGAIAWLYEATKAGKNFLALVSLLAGCGAVLATSWPGTEGFAKPDHPLLAPLMAADLLTSGLVLGTTIAAMFLGHWYLNTPTMQLAPLKRLVLLMAATTFLRMLTASAGIGLELSLGKDLWGLLPFIALRWLAGLVGNLMLAWMTWQTLKIPNTQSATGILYVGVIGVFLGELCSMLLSAQTIFPL